MQKVAFFDVDNTLLKGNISLMYAGFYFRRGDIPFFSMVKVVYYVLMHKMGRLHYQDFFDKSLSFIDGKKVSSEIKNVKGYYDRKVRGKIDPDALALLLKHRKEGYKIVLLTNAPDLFVDNLAKELSADDVICSQFELSNGNLTGRCKINCYGEMKLAMLRSYIKKKRLDPKMCYYYADNFSDLSALSYVGHPVAFKPDRKLRRHAEKEGWEIVR